MPTDLLRHEPIGVHTNIMSTSAPQAQTHANTALERHTAICATEGDAGGIKRETQRHMAAQDGRTKRKVDKKSPEYLMKSMLAGGLAGCAVRTCYNSKEIENCILIYCNRPKP